MVDQSVVELIQRLLRELRQASLPVSRAMLYGSHARGTASVESDIDVLLLSPAFDDATWEQEGLAWEIAQAIDWRIEPVLCGEVFYEKEDWHPLVDTVKREGFEIRAVEDTLATR
jgi:predicted nucleotidyltransferase